MTQGFSSNTSRPNSTTKNRFKPKKITLKRNTAAKPKKSPEQAKQEKLMKLKQQVADLRKQKAAMRTAYQQARRDQSSADFRGKLDAIDAKITQKMQQMRDVASDVAHKVGQVATAPARGAKYVWDQWEV